MQRIYCRKRGGGAGLVSSTVVVGPEKRQEATRQSRALSQEAQSAPPKCRTSAHRMLVKISASHFSPCTCLAVEREQDVGGDVDAPSVGTPAEPRGGLWSGGRLAKDAGDVSRRANRRNWNLDNSSPKRREEHGSYDERTRGNHHQRERERGRTKR